MILHLAEEDGFVSKDIQEELKKTFKESDLVNIYSYAGADHGFARTGGGNYDKAAAEISDLRTLSLLKKALIK